MIRMLLDRRLAIVGKDKLEAGDAIELESLNRQIEKWENDNPNTEYTSEYGIVWEPMSPYSSKGRYKGFVIYQYKTDNYHYAFTSGYVLRANSEQEIIQKIDKLTEDFNV